MSTTVRITDEKGKLCGANVANAHTPVFQQVHCRSHVLVTAGWQECCRWVCEEPGLRMSQV